MALRKLGTGQRQRQADLPEIGNAVDEVALLQLPTQDERQRTLEEEKTPL